MTTPSQPADSPTPGVTSWGKTLDEIGATAQPSLWSELFGFLKHNKKWWLLPILVVLAVFGAVAALAGSSVAPFIYTLF